jgi:hypothetical protein
MRAETIWSALTGSYTPSATALVGCVLPSATGTETTGDAADTRHAYKYTTKGRTEMTGLTLYTGGAGTAIIAAGLATSRIEAMLAGYVLLGVAGFMQTRFNHKVRGGTGSIRESVGLVLLADWVSKTGYGFPADSEIQVSMQRLTADLNTWAKAAAERGD